MSLEVHISFWKAVMVSYISDVDSMTEIMRA